MLIYIIIAVGFGLAFLAYIIEALFGQKSIFWLLFYAILGLLGASIGSFVGFGDTPIVLKHSYLNTLSLSLAVSALLVLCGLALHNRSGRPDAHSQWKRILLSYILVVFLLVMATMFFSIPMSGEAKIKAKIEQANYCQNDTNCAQLTGKCPFGCYVYVNKNEAGSIKEMIDNFQSSCVYGCIEAPDFFCKDNKCVPDLARQVYSDTKRPGASQDFVKDPVCDGGLDVCQNNEPLVSAPSGFDECVSAGNPVMESYPRKCIMDGVTYTELIYQTGDLLNTTCIKSSDCGFTPFEFAVMSNCPYGTACIDGNCAVVCAIVEHDADMAVSKSYAVSCEKDEDCNCADWDKSNLFPCECVDGNCASVVAAKKIFRELLAEKRKWNKDLVEVSLNNMGAGHAYGNVKFYNSENDTPGGGGYFFAARTDLGWEIILDGNGQIPCETLDEYKFPGNMKTQCVPTESEEEYQSAAKALSDFFLALSEARYKDAENLFAPEVDDPGAWEWLMNFSEDGSSGRAEALKNYCTAVGTCLQVQILSSNLIDKGFRFKVNLLQSDGQNFVLEPCCGATEEEMPSREAFDFNVKKIENKYKITTVPVYRP